MSTAAMFEARTMVANAAQMAGSTSVPVFSSM